MVLVVFISVFVGCDVCAGFCVANVLHLVGVFFYTYFAEIAEGAHEGGHCGWASLCYAMRGWEGNLIGGRAIGMVWMIRYSYLGLASMQNKRTDNAGFGALVLRGILLEVLGGDWFYIQV